MYETEEDEAKQDVPAEAQHSPIKVYGTIAAVIFVTALIFIAPLFKG